MSFAACCTCAALLSSIPSTFDEKTEKPTTLYGRHLECCGRVICARCIAGNSRFATYCPYCQVSSVPSSLPQGLRDPPAYSPPQSPRRRKYDFSENGSDDDEDKPPAYSASIGQSSHGVQDEKKEPAPDVLHFVNHATDTIHSLSLRYGVPAQALRKTNNLYTDHLLSARRTVLIPGEYYKGGVSLSPRPVEGEEEEARKSKIRRWMVACKVSEYVHISEELQCTVQQPPQYFPSSPIKIC